MKHLRSLTAKNFIMIASILVISYVLTGFVFSLTFYRYIYAANIDNMSSALTQAAQVVTAYGSQWELDGIEMRLALSNASRLTGCDILIADADGLVISCSDREFNCPHIGQEIPRNIQDMPQGQAYSGVGQLGSLYGAPRQYIAAPLVSGSSGKSLGYLLMSMDLSRFRQTGRQSLKLFIAVAGIVGAIGAVITYIASRHQTEPINEMAAMTQRFGRGEMSARVREKGRLDEIGQLQHSLNAMADLLENTENARRELVANVSHDLKTPITTIVGFTDGILDGTIPPEKEREYLQTISSEAKRMSRMVQNMLALSRTQSVEPSEMLRGTFDICEVMRICLIGFEGRIEEKGLDVSLTLPEEEIFVRGDADAITRVVTNLMDNAIKFAVCGSTLVLEVWKQNGKAYVSVMNYGETIPHDELPRIFERFHKGDKSRNLDKSGSGLGLFIVKSIIDSHREDIFVASENGATRFVFTLTLRPKDKA